MLSVGRNRYMTYITLCLLSLEVGNKSVLSQSVLQVQLVRYDNPLNLEYRPNESDGPYCCCNMDNPCFPSIQNFSMGNCFGQCDLRFSICAQSPSKSKESCISSIITSGPPIIKFSQTNNPNLFDGASSRLLLDLTLNASFTCDINLVVNIEERSNGAFDMVDQVMIPIRACNMFVPSTEYFGVRGIASITLAYIIATNCSEQHSSCSNPTMDTINSLTATETLPLPQGTGSIISTPTAETECSPPAFTIKMITITKTVQQMVTVQILETSNHKDCEWTESADSSSVWMPVSLVILAIAVVFILGTVVAITVALSLLKEKRKNEANDNYQQDTQQESMACNVENMVYALPIQSKKQYISGQNLPEPTPTYTDKQDERYLELSDATIPPCDYLQPKEIQT